MESVEKIELTTLSRRNFLRFASLGAGALVVITVAGKVGAQETITANSQGALKPNPASQLKSTISNNHGHIFLISLEELRKAGAKSYNIQGNAGHPHQIDVTSDVLKALVEIKVVEIESTQVAGHSHVVRLQII